jgi:DNA-binding HxlR family transcriptional regulator
MTAHSLEQETDTQAHAAANGATLMRSLFSLLGEKWTLTVLTALRTDRRRFSELKREIPGVSQRMLAQTLRELERAHFVDRVVLSTTPPRVEYALTDLGRGLFPHLRAMREWALLHEDKLFGTPTPQTLPPQSG